MNMEVIKMLKKKKMQTIFLFYVLLLLPLFTPLADNLTWLEKVLVLVVNAVLYGAILVLSTFISSRTERIIYSVILFFSIIPCAIYLGFLLFAHVLLEENSVISLFETNREESKEFVANYLSLWVNMGMIVYAAIPIVMLCKMKSFTPLKVSRNKMLFTLSIVVIFAVVGFNLLSRSVYIVSFYKTFIAYELRVHHEKCAVEERQHMPFEVKNVYNDSIPQTLVLVIGESHNKHHMSLYGYKRQTNPLLSTRNDSTFFVYRDVVSPQVHTIPVIRNVMTMMEPDNPEYFYTRPSLIELFNRAGYETIHITNQYYEDKHGSSFDILLSLAHQHYSLAPQRQYDNVVLATLKSVLEKESAQKRNRLIVIHLIGNHMAYEFRYPYQYNVFDHNKDGMVVSAPYRDEDAKRTIDYYDNSVLFNDYIIDNVISTLDKLTNARTAMIYFSDHGEELYDYRDYAGHVYEKVSPPMCEVPFLVWTSNSFKRSRPDLIFNTSRPYSTADFIYSMSDIGGLKYENYDDTRSIFSSTFSPRQRYVGHKIYENVKESFKNR